MDEAFLNQIHSAVNSFTHWLERYGEASVDHQSFYAGKLGGRAKALYYRKPLSGTAAVAPMVFCEAFIPSARRIFWKPQRFPIADAHYVMGFAFLAACFGSKEHYLRAVHFLDVLQDTRCRNFDDYCWGYPFDWQTRTGTIPEGTPLITTIPYVYEAFSQVYAIDSDPKWLRIMRSIAEHVLKSYRELQVGSDSASCAYTTAPDDPCSVINASAYRAFLLIKAGTELSEPRYLDAAKKNLNFVLSAQNPDGSWFYAIDGQRDFVDHFHTCFVLKALAKIERLTGSVECRSAIERGIGYYLRTLFDSEGLPLPFSKAPRLTVYRRELYDYAECINLAALLAARFPELDSTLRRVAADLFARWQKPDGSFRARELLLGWDNVPMHRWAQSQIFRSLCFLLSKNAKQKPEMMTEVKILQMELKVTD
jgi:hypothetical protein